MIQRCAVIVRLYNDRQRGVVPPDASLVFVRRTCPCELHQAWRRTEAELVRLRKAFAGALNPRPEAPKHEVFDRAGRAVLAEHAIPLDKPVVLVHYYTSKLNVSTAICGIHAREPNQVWSDGFPGSPQITCPECRVLLGLPIDLPPADDQPEQADADEPGDDQPGATAVKRRGRARVVGVKNRRAGRGNGRRQRG